jgi:superfamily I DNA/RNA helicase
LLERVVQAKQRLLGPHDDLSLVEDNPARRTELSRVYARYQDVLKLQELFDYEDLILEVVNLLRTDAAWRKSIHKRFTHIFVDEFQDINFGQYHLLRALTATGGQLCVIGDPDQSIYGFRGSDVRYFQNLMHDYPDTRLYQLNRNYRSTATLVDVCYHVIRGHQIPLHTGTHSRIRSDRPGASSITVIEAASPRAEAVAIGRTIERMVGGIGFHSVDFDKLDDDRSDSDCGFGEFAVLCRTGDQAQYIAQTLMAAGIPCQLASRDALQATPAAQLMAALKIVKGAGTYADLSRITDVGRSPVSRDTLSTFKLWAYARQLPLATAMHAVNRFPIPGLSVRRQQRLAELLRMLDRLRRETVSFSAARSLAHIVEQTRLSGRLDSHELDTFTALARPFGDRCTAFIASMALCKDTDYYQPHVEKVCVMTLHASKGLEFPMVFVAGCEDGLIPYRHAHRDALDLNEERRLFYVAMTRAQERLFLTWARKRTLHGKTVQSEISPFISDIDAQLIENHTSRSTYRKSNQKQLSLFE